MLAGYPGLGHLEYLAQATGTKEYATMLATGNLRCVHLTTHYSLRGACDQVKKDRIVACLKLTHDSFCRWGFGRPRIGVAALNPHGGEGGLFGTEERTAIGPGVARARAQGFPSVGPLPADTLIGQAARGKYDAVVAMYHDQGLIPLKLAAFGMSVNITVGLPVIRASVDHGPAYDIVGQGLADEGSLLEAIRLAATFAGHTSH